MAKIRWPVRRGFIAGLLCAVILGIALDARYGPGSLIFEPWLLFVFPLVGLAFFLLIRADLQREISKALQWLVAAIGKLPPRIILILRNFGIVLTAIGFVCTLAFSAACFSYVSMAKGWVIPASLSLTFFGIGLTGISWAALLQRRS